MEEKVQLGEFEELVLIMSAILQDEAYGVRVMDELVKQTGRGINISGVHTALDRLEKKGFLQSYMGGATAERGGRRKRLFRVTNLGIQAIEINRRVRNALYDQIPKTVIQPG